MCRIIILYFAYFLPFRWIFWEILLNYAMIDARLGERLKSGIDVPPILRLLSISWQILHLNGQKDCKTYVENFSKIKKYRRQKYNTQHLACVAGGIVCEGKLLAAENFKLLLSIPFAAPPLEPHANNPASYTGWQHLSSTIASLTCTAPFSFLFTELRSRRALS